jgi:hypothetical protein
MNVANNSFSAALLNPADVAAFAARAVLQDNLPRARNLDVSLEAKRQFSEFLTSVTRENTHEIFRFDEDEKVEAIRRVLQ